MSLPGSIGLLSRASLNGSKVAPSSIVLPGGGTITGSAGSISVTAGSTAQSITLSPSTTGGVGIGMAGDTVARLRVLGAAASAPSSDWVNTGAPVATFYGETTSGNGDLHLSGAATNPTLLFRKSNGTLAVPTTVASGETVGQFLFSGWDGGAFRNNAGIATIADAAVSSGVLPMRIDFLTGTTSRITATRLDSGGRWSMGVTGRSAAAWGTTGIISNAAGSTFTDSSTATSGTATVATFNSFSAAALAATNATVTTTDVFNVYMVAPTQGANQTITRKHTLGIIDSTSASSSITGGLIIAATLGTAATSVGIGGGNVNAGGSFTSGAPSGGTSNSWKLGTVAVVSPTSPNRTIEVEVGGTTYYIAAKTTNN